jgi:hypothetical protein
MITEMRPESPALLHTPLSRSLEDLLAMASDAPAITPNVILAHTGGRGLFLLMILLCLPFLVPFSIPGVSSFSGGVTLVLAFRMAWGLPARLPRWIGEHQMSPAQQQRLLRASVRMLRFIEKGVKPRGGGWLALRSVHAGNSLLLAFMAFLLALPLVVPFTNTIPAYAIVFLAISMMEGDGRTIWLGYALALATVVYFGLMAGTLIALTHRFLSGWFS